MNAVDVTQEQRRQIDELGAASRYLASLIEAHIARWQPVMAELYRDVVLPESTRREDFCGAAEAVGYYPAVDRLWGVAERLAKLCEGEPFEDTVGAF